jgi:hypothetical protein
MIADLTEYQPLPQERASSVQTYARIAGILMLLSFVAGGFGEAYVPSKLIVSADASATSENIRALARYSAWASPGIW